MNRLQTMAALCVCTSLLLSAGCSGVSQMTPSGNDANEKKANTAESNGMGFRHLMTLQNVPHGDPMAIPFTQGITPYIPQHVSILGSVTPIKVPLTSSAHYRALLRMTARLHSAPGAMKPDEIVSGDDNGGQAGLIINPTTSNGSNTYTQNGDGSVWVAQSYNFEDVPDLGSPYDSYGNYLYAPTTHGPNGNCIESSTAYFNTGNTSNIFGSQSGTEFLISDFCRDPGSIDYYYVPIDDNFVQNYVETYSNGDGYPEYQEEVYRDSNNEWHQLLYSNVSKAYQDIYDTTGTANIPGLGYEGWTLFETHFSNGTTCPTFYNISDSGLRVEVSGGNSNGNGGSGWTYVPNFTWQLPETGSGADPYCFDSSNPPYYTFQENTSDLGFFVTDPKSKPTPTPTHTPIQKCPGARKSGTSPDTVCPQI